MKHFPMFPYRDLYEMEHLKSKQSSLYLVGIPTG